MTDETRAVEACRRYVEADALVKRLTSKIGYALLGCPARPRGYMDEFDEYHEGHGWTHLREAFRSGRVNREKLAADCKLCLEAYDLIQQRKQARQAFGRAKAMITRIGKSK